MQLTEIPYLALKWLRNELNTAHYNRVGTSFSYSFAPIGTVATVHLTEDWYKNFDSSNIIVEAVIAGGDTETIKFGRKDLGSILHKIDEVLNG